MKKTSAKRTSVKKTKTSKSKRKLVAYGLGIGGCSALLAGSADATLVDVTFGFGTVLDSSDGISDNLNNKVFTSPSGDLGEIAWAGFVQEGGGNDGKTTIRLGSYGTPNKGFYFDGAFATTGEPNYVANTVSSTWGNGTHLSGNPQALGLQAGANTSFFSGNYGSLTLESDATGVIGFRTFTENWGYIEFDWDATAKTLTVLSAKAETVANTAVTFSAIPEANPAPVLALFSLGAVGLCMARRRKAALATA